jgi:hypothetical protein
MAIEYAGYVPTTKQVNWESLTDRFAEKVETSISARKEERISLDKIAADNEKMIKEQQLGKTEALNEFVTREGFKGKNFINNLNKELKLGHITPQQYKVAMNNVTENWGVLANSAKTYDDRRQAIFARQQADKDGNIAGSSYEVELQKLNEEALDLANNSTQWTGNGNLYLGKTDKEGKLVGELNDIRSLNTPENILVNRVDVNKNVTTFTNEWKANKSFQDVGKEGSITIEDIRLKMPEFNLATLYLAESIAPDSDPRRQISVLVDNGVIKTPEYYFKDEDRQSIINAKIAKLAEFKSATNLDPPTADEIADIELSLVKLVKKPNGVTDPELTPKQQKAVKDKIILEVEMQFASEETGKAQDVPTVRAPKTPTVNKAIAAEGHQTFLQVTDAFKTGRYDVLNAMNPNFTFKFNPITKLVDVVQNYTVNADGTKTAVNISKTSVKDPSELSRYFYTGGAMLGTPEEQWKRQEQSAIAAGDFSYTQTSEKEGEYHWDAKKNKYVKDAMTLYKVNKEKEKPIRLALQDNPNMTAKQIDFLFKMAGKNPDLSIEEIMNEIRKM